MTPCISRRDLGRGKDYKSSHIHFSKMKLQDHQSLEKESETKMTVPFFPATAIIQNIK